MSQFYHNLLSLWLTYSATRKVEIDIDISQLKSLFEVFKLPQLKPAPAT